ncbi:LPIN3 phosphatase, partial [Leiothrix lutea]|nr:LPIN3 phosphatase [Leiothrix lutea]
MNYVGQLAESVLGTMKELYQDLNSATLSGCIDVVVVRQPDNSFKCSPFHVRFGKLGVLRSKEKVVDIEINGEPVDLHMKLGDNGEAFFVEESEEYEGSIPSYLCTSPICKEQSSNYGFQPSCGLEATSTGAILRKRRRRRRRPKKKLVLDLDSDSNDESESEMTIKEPRELPAPRVAQVASLSILCSDAACSTFANLEETGLLQSREIRPYSDGELLAVDSVVPTHQSSPKSDSELEIKPQESFALGAESRLKWIWGKLPQVKTTAPAATTTSATPVPGDEATPLVATSEHLGRDSSPAEPQGTPCSSAVPVTEPTLAPQAGNSTSRLKDILCAVREKGFLGAYSVPQEKQKGDVNVVPEVQADVEPFEGATAPRQAGSEGLESQLERQRRQGEGVTESIKSPHLGPRAVYVEGLSKQDSKPVALYFHGSDTEQSLRPVTDPSSPLCMQLPSTLPASSPMGSDSTPTVALSLCGGLRGNRQISHEKFMEHMVSYEQFAENPRLVSDPNLVIRINKKYYNWAVAGPIVLALQAFQKNIPESIIDELVKEKMPRRDRRRWFSWRRREFPTEGVCLQHFVKTLADPFPSLCRHEEKESFSDNQLLQPGDTVAVEASAQKPLPTYKKSLRLSSEQIGRLNLQDGPNEVAFSVTTQYQGTCRCEATIYLWNWNEKVVISDIDGTITKSDALGQILPQLGKDWTHRGIVKLFHKIHL